MKAIKYFVITALLISGLTSCLVERGGPGYYGRPRPHHHHHYGHGHYR